MVLVRHVQPDGIPRRSARRELEHKLHSLAELQRIAIGHPTDAAGHGEGLPSWRPRDRRATRPGRSLFVEEDLHVPA